MKPLYRVHAWQEDGWWLARVMAASRDADPAPLNALTQARSLTRIEPMARDQIATILDAAEDDFEVDGGYTLPGNAGEHVHQARAARAWLEAAQNLWQEQSTAAARELADQGFSLRDTAALLGLSHQRVDQLLSSQTQREQSPFRVFYYTGDALAEDFPDPASLDISWPRDLIMVTRDWAALHGSDRDAQPSEVLKRFMDQFRASRTPGDGGPG